MSAIWIRLSILEKTMTRTQDSFSLGCELGLSTSATLVVVVAAVAVVTPIFSSIIFTLAFRRISSE